MSPVNNDHVLMTGLSNVIENQTEMFINGNIDVGENINNEFIDLLYGIVEVLVDKNIISGYEILQKEIEYKKQKEHKHNHLRTILYASLTKAETILLKLEQEDYNE